MNIEFKRTPGGVIASPDEATMKVIVERANARRSSARDKKRVQAYFIEGTQWDSLDTEIQSMLAEHVVAHYFGQTNWEPTLHKPDKNEGDLIVDTVPIEVKSTSRARGSLPIKADETRNRPYVLVIVEGHSARIAGWIMAQNGKQCRFWRDDVRYPAYFVPQAELYPISMLKAILEDDGA
jgi:hypothetical protein